MTMPCQKLRSPKISRVLARLQEFGKVSDMTANEFRKLREEAGLSQQALANAIGVNLSTAQRMESGKRAISKMAEFVMLRLDEITVTARTATKKNADLEVWRSILRELFRVAGYSQPSLQEIEFAREYFKRSHTPLEAKRYLLAFRKKQGR